VPPISLHCELGPQGDGTHGFMKGGGSAGSLGGGGTGKHLVNGSPVNP